MAKISGTSEDSDQPVHPHSLIRVFADQCAVYSAQAVERIMNKNPCHTGLMYRLIGIFASHTGLIVGFVVHWLSYVFMEK